MNIILLICGLIISTFAAYVLIRHKYIWEKSLVNYKKHDSTFIDTILRPSQFSYFLNKYFIWPLALLIGIIMIWKALN